MSLYTKYILPKYLDWSMRQSTLKEYRREVASAVSGMGLEIGFGSGLNLPYYRNVTKLYALDPSEELYDFAAERIASAPFPVEHLPASAEQIPLPDNSLDFVVSTWTLCSIPHPDTALKEVLRVLKPGGIFSFVEHGRSPKTSIATIQSFLTPASKHLAGGCHLDRNIEKLIHDAGFDIQKLETFSPQSKPLRFTYKGVAMAHL